jgi:hypothetical protein
MLHFLTSFLVLREDNAKHLTTCVGQMPKNLPAGKLLVTFQATGHFLKEIRKISSRIE